MSEVPSFESRDTITMHDGPVAHDSDIRRALGYRTTPIFFFEDDRSVAPHGRGSGVLVRIADRRFILTAGHCVEPGRIAIGARAHQHRFILDPFHRGYVGAEGVDDFGYFEVPPPQIGAIEAGTRIFLPEHSIKVLTQIELKAHADFAILGGYPAAYASNDPEAVGVVLLGYYSNIEGTGNAPTSPSPVPSAYESIDIWVPEEGNLRVRAEELTPEQMESLGGASGGGWWYAGMIDRPLKEWAESDMTLIGTHVGRVIETVKTADGATHRFVRVALIGNHLALIANDYPDLRDHIFATWPPVRQFADALTDRQKKRKRL